MNPEALMRRVAETFEEGDLRPLFDAIHPDIIWKSGASTGGGLPFGGTYKRREGVLTVTSQLSAAYVFRKYRPKEIVCAGDIVWGLFEVEGSHLEDDRSAQSIAADFQLECAIRWRLRQSKIVEHQSFFDTETLLRQQPSQVHR
jgi:ketosteroid isomerase-like protein